MLLAQNRSNRRGQECRTLGTHVVRCGVWADASDSIQRDICVSTAPNCEERRQNIKAALKDDRCSNLRVLRNQEQFPQRNQPVDPIVEQAEGQLKRVEALPEEGGPEMATLSHFPASLLYGVFSGTPTDLRRRLHG
jgi:hypothetical protein